MATRKLKQQPQLHFASGVLAFEKSGHTLTCDKKYYVCSQKQKQACKLPERRIKVRNFNRSFVRLAKKFEIPQNAKDFLLVKKTMAQLLHDMIDEWTTDFESYDLYGNQMELMKQDLKEGKKRQFKNDAEEAAKHLIEDPSNDVQLAGSILLGIVMTFASEKISETYAGMTLAWLSEKIYISDDGKITKIKLNLLGDFAFQFMRKNVPTYQKPFKYFIDSRELGKLDYRDLAKQVRWGKIKEPIIPPLRIAKTMVFFSKFLFTNMHNMTPEKIIAMLSYVDKNASGYTLARLMKIMKRG